nr:hypothetical protein [Anaerolineae bacterium]
MLNTLDLTAKLDVEEYAKALVRSQLQLRDLVQRYYRQQRSAVVVIEHMPAVRAGNIIHRVIERIDPRNYRVYSGEIAEQDTHPLYPFWIRLPLPGQITLFHGSWYERVLSGRVAGRVSEEEYQRAYHEINTFERQVVDGQIVLLKFWLHHDYEDCTNLLNPEQIPTRQEWNALVAAANDVLLNCSLLIAPWTLVPAREPLYAQVAVLDTLVDALADAINHQPPDPFKPGSGKGKSRGKKKKKEKTG